jgi:hypothetical protein
MEVFVLLLVVGVVFVFGALGSWIAMQKNRDNSEGFALGCIFGPLGVLIEALLPTLSDHSSQKDSDHSSQKDEAIVLTVTSEQWEAIRKREAEDRAKREANEKALELFRRERETEEMARRQAEAEFRRLEKERNIREREERNHIRRQEWTARRQKLQGLPEWVKIALGVTLGIVVIAVLVSMVVGLSPK